jgi:formamidopyrimidine-DNA glycosylase
VPELPDVDVYVEALRRHAEGEVLERVRVASPFLVRSFDPKLSDAHGKVVRGFRRLGKRIVWELDGELFLVLHPMIAGRLRWKEPGAAVPKKIGLAAFDFARGSVILTEASKKKRASLYVVRGTAAVDEHDPGGLEPLDADLSSFRAAILRESHTLKRTLSDPRVLSGVGNAYSDEILHRAHLSPVKQTKKLTDDEIARLHGATRDVLLEARDRIRAEVGDGFPDKVTAFRPDMAVHGKYGEPCPVCGTKVQRIVRADNEVNYCPTCQTGGKLLADRSLSRLIKDWPKTLEELEERKRERRG